MSKRQLESGRRVARTLRRCPARALPYKACRRTKFAVGRGAPWHVLVELLGHIVTNDVDKNDVENVLCLTVVERRIDSHMDPAGFAGMKRHSGVPLSIQIVRTYNMYHIDTNVTSAIVFQSVAHTSPRSCNTNPPR